MSGGIRIEKQKDNTPTSWKLAAIDEICTLGGGKTPSKSNEDNWHGSIPWVSPKDFDGVKLDETENHLTQHGVSNSSINLYESGNIAMVVRSGVLKHSLPVAQLKSKMSVNQDIKILKPDNKKIISDYFLNALLYEADRIRASCVKTGTTVESVETAFLKSYRLPLPPLSEQRRIAEILSTVDELIQQTDAIIEETERLKRGIMQDLLTQGIGHESFKLASFGSVDSKIPAKWTICKLEDIAQIKRGASPRPIGDSKFFGGDIGWIRISDINASFKYITNSSEYLSDLGVSKSVRVHPGEVLLSISASVGECVIVDFEACIHDGIVAIRNLSDDLNNEFLYYYLTSSRISFATKGQTGTQSNINSNLVKNIEILIPPLPEQQQIAEILSTVDDTIHKEQKTKTELKALKRGLMQNLLTGKVRVPVEA